MKFSSAPLALIFCCAVLNACNQTNEEKALAAIKGSEHIYKQTGPECSQFNADHTPKVPGGCTQKQWDEWHKTH
jgi:hypothetical protein